MKTRLLGLALAFAAFASFGSAITPGNLVICRVGDGVAALGTTAAAVYLDEYTTLGTFVQSIALPTTGAGQITLTGNSTTEGILTLSQDGQKIVFAGYRTAVGSSSFTGANKAIGVMGLNGIADTSSFSVTDAGASATRSATSTDGSSLFYFTTAGAVRYVSTPGSAATSTVIDARNSRQVLLSGNKLFASNGSTGVTGKVQDYGILPTTTTAANPDVVLTTADAVNGFALFDLDAGVAGVDTIYALSTVASQLIKWTYNGSTWSASGSLSSSAQDITGYADGTGVHLFLTSGSALFSETDTSGYGGTLNGTISSIATPGLNTAFRGISMFPSVVPEPSTVSLGLLGLASLIAIRRRKA